MLVSSVTKNHTRRAAPGTATQLTILGPILVMIFQVAQSFGESFPQMWLEGHGVKEEA